MNSYAEESDVILCFNKDDLFCTRIRNRNLRNSEKRWFTDYKGGCNELAAFKYIEKMFLSINRNQDKKVLACLIQFSRDLDLLTICLYAFVP